jgi:hypothetical protein
MTADAKKGGEKEKKKLGRRENKREEGVTE